MSSDNIGASMINAKTLTLHWHEGAAAIYSVCCQPGNVGERSLRLVTGGGDNNVRIWSVEYNEEGNDINRVQYLSSISKHTQAVNCVRFNPNGTLLATASDDGSIMIWEKNDSIVREFGADPDDDIKESWVIKVACFSSSMSEIYDICWSPDSKYICCGLMDNIIRIFSVSNGSMVKQIAEHSHYVQGVTWDPRNEYICSQSADRSVHVYKISHGETGELIVGPTTFYKSVKNELPATKLSQLTDENLKKKEQLFQQEHDQQQQQQQQQQQDDRPSEQQHVQEETRVLDSLTTTNNNTRSSTPATESVNNMVHTSSEQQTPIPVTPLLATTNNISSLPLSDTNTSMVSTNTTIGTTNMEPPQAPRHKRTYSNSSTNSSHSHINRCLSPLPLPAVMPQSPSHLHIGLASINKVSTTAKTTINNNSSVINPTLSPAINVLSPTLNSVPISYKQHYLYHNETLQSFFRRLTFSPDGSLLITTCGIYKPNTDLGKEEIQNTVYVYTRAGLNRGPVVHIPGLKKPSIAVRFSPARYKLQPKTDCSSPDVFAIPYRMLFAVATQDSVVVYDTQRLKCVAIATSLHYAIITDITWSSDGKTIFVSSNDGFISCIVLSDDIVGEIEGGFAYTQARIAAPSPMTAPTPITPSVKRERDIATLVRESDKRTKTE